MREWKKRVSETSRASVERGASRGAGERLVGWFHLGGSDLY